MSGRILRLGILGCANIARQFARDIRSSSVVRACAVASRDLEKAAAFATASGIARHYGSYEALLAAPDLDAIYLPLPNSMHAAWAIRALESGKHVLCEKPLALGPGEARAMFRTAERHRVILLESFPYQFQPQTLALRALLDSGTIGEIRSMQATFCFTVPNPESNIRMKPELGGGALLDAGSYPLSLIRLVMGDVPSMVHAAATWAETGVDIALMATLHYADGRRAQLSCAMNAAYHRYATIEGSAGAIETDFLNHTGDSTGSDPSGYLPGRLRVRRGTATTVPLEEIPSKHGRGFLFAAEAFARLVLDQDFLSAKRTTEASVDNAATLEALAHSARAGRAIDVRAV